MNRNLLALLLLGAVTTSQAVTVTTGATSPAPGVSTAAKAPITPEAAKAMADDSSGLRKGTIGAVDIANGTFSVFGEAHSFDVAKVQIFGRNGKPTNAYALQRGAAVRFTLDPADPTRRRVAVIYLD